MENSFTDVAASSERLVALCLQEALAVTAGAPPPKRPESKTKFVGKSASSSGKLKVIVADDEPLVALTMTEILEDEGFEVVSVPDGATAVEMARKLRPDLILSDVMMPEMNGIDAAIKIWEFLPECRIILLSGQAATGDLLKQAHDQGYDFEVVTKPISPDTLLDIMRHPEK